MDFNVLLFFFSFFLWFTPIDKPEEGNKFGEHIQRKLSAMHFSGAIQNISVSLKDANKVRKRGTGKGERGKENGERRTEKRKPKTRKMERESRTESTAVIRMKSQNGG